MSALSDLINQELDRRGLGGASLRHLSERSDNRLSKDAVRIYRAGLHGRPTEEVLTAWAELLDVPISQLRRAAGDPAGEQGPYVPPAEASRLSERQRAAITELIRAVVGEDQQTQQPSVGVRYTADEGKIPASDRASIDQKRAEVAARADIHRKDT